MVREHGFQPAFEALDATDERRTSPGFDVQPWSAVEYWICWCPDDDGVLQAKGQKVGDVTALEGRAIAEDIRRLHDDAGVRFGDVAVLLRATTKQGEILDAFRELGVPFEVAREREYYRQREIIEAAGLVRAILEPADALALRVSRGLRARAAQQETATVTATTGATRPTVSTATTTRSTRSRSPSRPR